MTPFNGKDLDVFHAFRKALVLQKISGHQIDQRHGVVAVLCPDCDQFADIYAHHSRLQKRQRRKSRIHPITRNGGTLRLIASSKTNKRGRTTAKDLLDEIKESLLLKNIKTVIVYVHAPCAKANGSGITFYERLRDLFEAKKILKTLRRSVPGLKVACFCHIDFGPNFRRFGKRKRRLTYFASREAWKKYLRSKC